MVVAGPLSKVDKKLLEYFYEISASVIEAIDRRFENLFSEHLSFGLEESIKGQECY